MRYRPQELVHESVQRERAAHMERQANDPVRLQTPDEHLSDREGEVRRKPQLETERMRGVVGKVLSGEKYPIVEDPRVSQKRPVKAAREPRDQACGNPVREPPDDACEHKKRYPEGYLFSQRSCG